MKTKIKTRRYVTELMDVYWVAGLGWVFEVEKGSDVFERPELVLFYAFLIYQDLFCICKFFRIFFQSCLVINRFYVNIVL